MKFSRRSTFALLAIFGTLFGFCFAAALHAADPSFAWSTDPFFAEVTGPTAVALPPVSNPWLALVPLAVPLVVTTVKSFVPRLPKLWLPVIAASIGLALALFDHFTGTFGGNPMAVAFLGAAGTGLREIYDQVRQALAVPNV